MTLHGLTGITLGVPDVAAATAFYTDFGLTPLGDGLFATADGGQQLSVAYSPQRRLIALGVGADDPDDLDRVARSLARLGVTAERSAAAVRATDPGTRVAVTVSLAPRVGSTPLAAPAINRPGEVARPNARADAVLREGPVRPRKLGHVVLGSTDQDTSHRFFTDGLGFRVSDTVPGIAAFLRCSTDHHNVLVQSAPVSFLHHTSWQVDDVDEVGRGASAMLEGDPARHVWGLGRHAIGSNFFWYLKDPAGNFAEYHSDLDCIVDDALWTPGVWEGARSLYQWGPPPPPSFLAPDDLAALMTGAHSG
ncbi:VOC family protein [Cryptosporangium sp. NPDC048952]|uniref:VOC family protein n=1 Tax=Cryptosporangium sp. NPDC048952 TaxID=3363961 RepID=UPI003712FF80